MRSVIWKYELMHSYPTVEALDAAMGPTRTMERTVSFPFDSSILGRVRTDPLAHVDSRAADDVMAIVGYFVVDPDPKARVEPYRVWLTYTGAEYPGRTHIGSVLVCQHRPRIVHVFMGPA
jgi:hypothetical protein